MRNLADVAGSRTLETGLRTAAAEQLCSVLLAPGVASAVLRNDDRHVSRNDDRSLLRNGPSGGNGEVRDEVRIWRADEGQSAFGRSCDLISPLGPPESTARTNGE